LSLTVKITVDDARAVNGYNWLSRDDRQQQKPRQ